MQKRNLADLGIDESGVVAEVDCTGERLRRLLDLGVTEGTRAEALFRSPVGDPTAYFIRGAVIALRRGDAEKITIKENK